MGVDEGPRHRDRGSARAKAGGPPIGLPGAVPMNRTRPVARCRADFDPGAQLTFELCGATASRCLKSGGVVLSLISPSNPAITATKSRSLPE